jgi:LSU ribosomal protein L24P
MSTHVWKIHKDDNVMILVGKDKGKIGKVVKILRSKKQVIVERQIW